MRDPKAPIANPEAERGYLGCALLDSNLVPELDVALLQDIRHQALALQLKAMHQQGNPIDLSTVSVFLVAAGKVDDVGGLPYVAGLPEATPSAANFTYYQGELEDAALRRRHEALGDSIKQRSRDPGFSPEELQDRAESEILELRPKSKEVRTTNKQALQQVIEDMEYAHNNPGKPKGLTTGFRELDSILWGMEPGQLIFVGGRPSQGKSVIMTQIAYHCAQAGTPAGVFTLEMTQKEIMFRLLSATSGVDGMTIRRGEPDSEQQVRILEAMRGLCKVPVHIDDGDVHSMDKIRVSARRLLKDEGIGLLVIDYLQLIQGSNRKASRYESVTEVSSSLKRLARELRIPIIVGSQFSREVEKEERRPKPSDLRDSGSIEQDADALLLLYNRQDEEDGGRVPSELIVAKGRNGRLGTVQLRFNKPMFRFEEVPL